MLGFNKKHFESKRFGFKKKVSVRFNFMAVPPKRRCVEPLMLQSQPVSTDDEQQMQRPMRVVKTIGINQVRFLASMVSLAWQPFL